MSRRRIAGAAAVLGTAAGLAGTLVVGEGRAGDADPELEARVLMETIDAHERRLNVDPRTP